MLHLVTTFLTWDLAVAAALAVVLGVIVVVQAAGRAAAETLRGTPLLTRAEAAASVPAARLSHSRAVDMVGSVR